MIVPATTSQSLAAALARETGDSLAGIEIDTFPDGERLIGVPEFDTDRAVIVASTISSTAHIEVLQLQDAVIEWGAKEVVTVIPYLGYSRQDAPYGPAGDLTRGYPISARAVARAIGTGSDRVLTVTPHEPAVTEFFDIPAEALDATGRLAEPLPADLDDPLFLAPDSSALSMATSVRDAYGDGSTDAFEKHRSSGENVEIVPSNAPVADRDVVVVDDIIATGKTMSESIAVLTNRGANRIFVGCVHPILAENARTRLVRAGVEAIYGTDTIERQVSSVSVAPVIAESL